MPGDLALDEVGSAHRHGRFIDDDRRGVHRLTDFPGSSKHVAQVRRAVLALRGTDGDKDQVRHVAGQRLEQRQAGADAFGKLQAPRLRGFVDDLLEPGLVYRDHALAQAGDFRRIGIDANHRVFGTGQACGRHQTHIPRANHQNFHERNLAIGNRPDRVIETRTKTRTSGL